MKNSKYFLGCACAGAMMLAGPANAEIDTGNLYITGGVALTSYTVAGSATGFTVGGGYEINEMFSVEGAWLSQGNANYDVFGFGTNLTYSASGIQVSALARYPISDAVNVYGRLGLYRVTWNADIFGTPAKFSANDFFYGIGGSYGLNDKIEVIAEYNLLDLGNALILGGRFHF